jgi:hypothetical protein
LHLDTMAFLTMVMALETCSPLAVPHSFSMPLSVPTYKTNIMPDLDPVGYTDRPVSHSDIDLLSL